MATILKEYEDGAVDYAKAVVTTTNSTPEIIDVITIPTDESYDIEVNVSARKTDFTEKATFNMKALYVNDSGTVSRQGVINYLHRQRQTDWNVTFNVSGDEVRVLVTGVDATDIDWKCERFAYIMEKESDV